MKFGSVSTGTDAIKLIYLQCIFSVISCIFFRCNIALAMFYASNSLEHVALSILEECRTIAKKHSLETIEGLVTRRIAYIDVCFNFFFFFFVGVVTLCFTKFKRNFRFKSLVVIRSSIHFLGSRGTYRSSASENQRL